MGLDSEGGGLPLGSVSFAISIYILYKDAPSVMSLRCGIPRMYGLLF